MHICFFNRSYWPDQAATGQFLTELAEDLVAHHGCRVTVVAGRALHGSGGSSARGWPVADETHNGVEIRRAHGTCFQPRRFAGRAANYLTYVLSAELAARQIGYADVVVSLTDPPIIGLTAARVARRTGARFVFLCEDIFPEVAALLDDFHNERVNQALDRVNRRLIGSADASVTSNSRLIMRHDPGAPRSSTNRSTPGRRRADRTATRPGAHSRPSRAANRDCRATP